MNKEAIAESLKQAGFKTTIISRGFSIDKCDDIGIHQCTIDAYDDGILVMGNMSLPAITKFVEAIKPHNVWIDLSIGVIYDRKS